MEYTLKKRSSCGRGVLKLKSWKPLPRPGESCHKQQQFHTQKPAGELVGTERIANFNENAHRSRATDNPTTHVAFNGLSTSVKRSGNINGSVDAPNQKPVKSIAKYSYTANPERPGGFEELTMKQGEHIYFHEIHHLNPHWVKAENQQGEVGYVPATYIMKIESKPSQLPWLENKRMLREAEKEKEEKNKSLGFGVPAIRTLPPKKYVSAYGTQVNDVVSDFSCTLCGRTFNGPKPYRLHMASKAHKEEEEAQRFR